MSLLDCDASEGQIWALRMAFKHVSVSSWRHGGLKSFRNAGLVVGSEVGGKRHERGDDLCWR